MNVTTRNYKLLEDFNKVSEFLTNQYKKSGWSQCMLQPMFEYAHTHCAFNHELTPRFRIWEEDGNIVAIANYEMNLGDVILSASTEYEFLYEEMLTYAEKMLCEVNEEKHRICINSNNRLNALNHILELKGYQVLWESPMMLYDYAKGFSHKSLPEGFQLLTLEEENDIKKIDECLYYGFDHGNEMEYDLDGRIMMQSGPHFRKDLTHIIKAPNGDYACFVGMWLDANNDYAYLEPLATRPEYRRMGLAKIALMEAMKRTQNYDIKYCIGGSREFYAAIGFEPKGMYQYWKKEW